MSMDNQELYESKWKEIRESFLRDNEGSIRLRTIKEYIYDTYQIPINVTDLINSKLADIDKEEATLFLKGCLLDNKVVAVSKLILTQYFSYHCAGDITSVLDETKIGDNGQLSFTIKKYDTEILPYKFNNVLQINNSQWVCSLHIKDVIDLYLSQLIHYNTETQRQQTVVKTSAGSIKTKITVNQKSVKEIEKLLEKGLFISNFITINVNEDSGNEFVYDGEDGSFTLKKGHFDIIDGFHRMLAMSQAYSKNNNIDYITGVHIVAFPTDKAKRYIVQEDKKNKINKQYIKTLDGSDLINVLIDRLNETSYCETFGNIREDGKFSKTLFYSAISKTYGKIKERSDIGEIVKKLAPVINDYCEHRKLERYNILDLLTICQASKKDGIINYNKIGFDSNTKLFSSRRSNVTTELMQKADWYTS